MEYLFKKAQIQDVDPIWKIIEAAKERRRLDGSSQWQDGYPNLERIKDDINMGFGHILLDKDRITAYTTAAINAEPAYNTIVGQWLSNKDFVVFHRLAVAEAYLGKGIAQHLFQCIETFAKKHKIKSIKADTNFDNAPMLHLFQKNGYHYCGKVYFRGSERLAYEKLMEL